MIYTSSYKMSFSRPKMCVVTFCTVLLVVFANCFMYSQSQQNKIDNLLKQLAKPELKGKNKADVLFNLGNEYYNSQQFPLALEYYEKALTEFDINGDSVNKAQTIQHIGTVYSDINDYHKALQHYLKALELYEVADKKENIAYAISDIGELHLRFENFTKAFEYFFKAKNLYLKDTVKFKEKLKNNNFLLGIAFGSVEKTDSSLYYFERVLKQTNANGNELFYGGLLNNIGAIYSKKGEHKKAVEYYNQASTIFYKVNNERGIGVSLSNIAYILKKEKNNSEAINMYIKAINYFTKTNELNNLADAYLNLSEIYQAIRNFEQALYFSQKYIDINDKLNNSDLMGQIALLEVQQEIRKKEQAIKIIEQEKLLVEKDNKLKNLGFYITVGGAFLLAVIGALIFRNLRISLKNNQLKQDLLVKEKIQLEDNLDYKNKELEKFAFHIIEKNELLAQLKNELKEINTQLPENAQRVREISSTITNNLQLDKDRKDFEFQLDSIHQSFFLKLDNLYPGLTKSERRLCSLLVMDLSSKDIATILNISPDGVKKGRYRLRKKLNLSEDENMTNFLKKI